MADEGRARRSSMPEKTVPPVVEDVCGGDEVPSSSKLERLIVVAIDDSAARLQALEILGSDNGLVTAGPDGVPHAAVVLVDAPGDPRGMLGLVRAKARSDAAILVLLNASTPAFVEIAHHAGAFACLRAPLVAAELRALVASALEQKAARDQVTNLERLLDLQSHLASIGRISAGLCHELSNPLAAAKANLETLDAEMTRLLDAAAHSGTSEAERVRTERALSEDDAKEAVRDTLRALQRMEAVLGIVKGLSHPAKRAVGTLDVGEVVRGVVADAAEALAGVCVELAMDDRARAHADPSLLGQIVLNLATNAAQAAKSLPSPRVRFHVYTTSTDAIVSVRDNGPGIAASDRDKIFEPFFTTRRDRGGTGLGLALCREYALQMGADISLWSAPGRGACFRVRMRRERV